MKNFLILTTLFLSISLFSQINENEEISYSLSQEDLTKIRTHLYQNFRTPKEVFSDSTISVINYTIKFEISQEGIVSNPIITQKNIECPACERAIKNVFARAPKVYFNLQKFCIHFRFEFKLKIDV